MPAVTFSHANGPASTPSNWASTSSSGARATNTYTIIDNLQWIKGRHNFTFGAQVQWLETNGARFGGASKTLSLTFSDTIQTGAPRPRLQRRQPAPTTWTETHTPAS